MNFLLNKSLERAEGNFPDFKRSFARYVFAKKYVKKDDIILDIASGSGYGTYYLSKYCKNIYGVEIDSKSISFAKQNFNKKNIKYTQNNATNTKFKDNMFDVIISFETIEHIKDYKKFLLEMKRILKSGGVFIISTPNRIIASPSLTKPLHDYHVQEWSINELNTLLSRDFIILESYVQNFNWSKTVVHLRYFYSCFFSLFGQSVLRYSLKLLQYIVFNLLKKQSNNILEINKNNISILDSEKYSENIYFPQKYNETEKDFGIQLHILTKK